MANVTDYGIRMWGHEHELLAIAEFLRPAVENNNCYYGAFILHVDRLPLEVDKESAHSWIGLACRTDTPEPWYEIGPCDDADAFRKEARAVFEQLGIADLVDLPIREPQPQCLHGLVDAKVLTISGSCKWCPPGGFVEGLSRKWPMVFFEFYGTTENELYEEWEAVGGVLKNIVRREWHYWDNTEVWYVKDGQECDPPLVEPYDDDPEE